MSARLKSKSQPKKSASATVVPVKVCDYPPLDLKIGKVLAGSMRDVSKSVANAAFIMVLQSAAGYDIFPARPDTLQEYLDAEPTLLFIPKQSLLGPAATVGPIAALFKSECVRGRAIFENSVYQAMLTKFETVRWSNLLHHGTVGVSVAGWRSNRENKQLLVKPTVKSLAPRQIREARVSTKTRKVAATPKGRLVQIFNKIVADCEKQGVRDCEDNSKQTLNVSGYPEVMPKAKVRAANPKLILNYEGTFLCSSDPASFADAMVDLREEGLIEGDLLPGEYAEDSEEEETDEETAVDEEEDEEADEELSDE